MWGLRSHVTPPHRTVLPCGGSNVGKNAGGGVALSMALKSGRVAHC